MTVVPGKDWYKEISGAKSLPTRCPYASVKRCPRYYQSISLHGDIGGTSLNAEEDNQLLNYWSKSDLWPKVEEQATSVFKVDDQVSFISIFCPEVTYQRFGFFCSHLSFYTDSLDRRIAHENLSRRGAEEDDLQWRFESSTEEHFSDCDLYSLIRESGAFVKEKTEPEISPWWREHAAKIAVGSIVALTAAIFKFIFS